MTNEKNFNQANQTNNQSNQKVDAKTVVNGKVVSLQQAQAMEEQFNSQNNQTGIQAHHDNSSEAVQAGQTAQNSSQMLSQESGYNVKPMNVQSGQTHLEGMQGQAMSQQQKDAQADQKTIQNSVDAKAKAKAKKDN